MLGGLRDLFAIASLAVLAGGCQSIFGIGSPDEHADAAPGIDGASADARAIDAPDGDGPLVDAGCTIQHTSSYVNWCIPAATDSYTMTDIEIDSANSPACAQTETVDHQMLCLIHHGTITIPAGVTVRMTGTHAVAFLADANLVIAGTLDSSGLENKKTAGTAPPAATCAPTSDPVTGMNGGGGGAGGSGGGIGGTGGTGSTAGATMGTGGAPHPAIASAPLTLQRGCDGDDSAPATVGSMTVARGGYGGGQLYLGAHQHVTVSGSVLANGGPAPGSAARVGGGGGGAGGFIVIETAAGAILTGGTLAVNGGGGSGGGGLNTNGSSGSGSSGGAGGPTEGGAGGSGAVAPQSTGANGTSSTRGGGGGGGGRGWILVDGALQ